MQEKKIAVLVGSLRQESFTRKIANAVVAEAASFLKFEFVDIGRLPLYNQDLESAPPAEWVTFREQIKTCNGVLFATPEYNRSIPSPLKNALDVGSRPYESNAWLKKPAAVISVSPGALGGFGANHHLRQTLVFLDMPAMPQPEAYIGHVTKLLDEKGEVNNEDTKKILKKFSANFAKWVDMNSNSL